MNEKFSNALLTASDRIITILDVSTVTLPFSLILSETEAARRPLTELQSIPDAMILVPHRTPCNAMG